VEKKNQQQALSNDGVHLEFEVGQLRFCVSVLEVEAIVSPPKMIHVPLSGNVVVGCFDRNGRTVTVLSMHNKFGLPFTLQEKESHIILATVDDELKGFWVDQAIDIVDLNGFESSAGFDFNERRAYSNFLTRDEKIILQTSFQRLYECDSSDLSWMVSSDESKATSIDTEEEVDNLEIEEVTESDSSDKAEPIEVVDVAQTPESIDIADEIVETDSIENSYNSKHDTSAQEENLFDSQITNNVRTSSESVSYVQHDKRPYGSHRIHYDDYAGSGESQQENKSNEFLMMAVALLVLIIIGLASIYLINASSVLESKRSNKVINLREPGIPVRSITPTERAIITTDHTEFESNENESSGNELLNEVAEEIESTPAPSARVRVFELYVNEQSDSNQYAITSFEPVQDQREGEYEQGVQTFTHIVVKGDTLWHITRRYLDNPHRYPELAKASHIKNPHRIYPGDVVKIIINRSSTE